MVPLLNKMMHVVGRLSTLHWFIIMIIIWVPIYTIYMKFMERYLRTMDLSFKVRKNLIEVIFRLCLIGTSVPFIVSCISVSKLDVLIVSSVWINELRDQLSICKIHEEIYQLGVKPLFVIHCSFSVLDTLHTGYYKGWKNLDFFQKQLVPAIFFVTYFSKCPLLGLTLYLLAIRSALLELGAKLYALIASFTNSSLFGKAAKLMFVYHLFLWVETFLITLPIFLNTNKNITSSMMYAEIKTLIVLDFLLWLFVIVSTLNSVFGRCILSLVMPTEARRFSFIYCLFGDSINPNETRAGKSKPNDETPVNKMKLLLQTVRCVIVIRRKLRRMREDKKTEAAKSNGSVDDVAQQHSGQLHQRVGSNVQVKN